MPKNIQLRGVPLIHIKLSYNGCPFNEVTITWWTILSCRPDGEHWSYLCIRTEANHPSSPDRGIIRTFLFFASLPCPKIQVRTQMFTNQLCHFLSPNSHMQEFLDAQSSHSNIRKKFEAHAK